MNSGKAKQLLVSALVQVNDAAYSPRYANSATIGEIILGSHLTFRYMLITGVLGKATDPSVHPRSLQSGADLEGAYDARSLCHHVVVPFERENLSDSLGGSNEPFLNKPARYTEVDRNNPVRAGHDRNMLHLLYSVLEDLNEASPSEAFDALCDCLFFCGKRVAIRRELLPTAINASDGLRSIVGFVDRLVSRSLEGETSAIAVGAALSCLRDLFPEDLRVIVHPTNQAGTSSNEVSDVDAYTGDRLRFTVEVKDKEFTFEDVQHAAKKVREVDHETLIFAIGPHGRLKSVSPEDVEARLSNRQFSVVFVSVSEFIRSILTLAPSPSPETFYRALVEHCNHARVKDKTLQHVSLCASEAGWI